MPLIGELWNVMAVWSMVMMLMVSSNVSVMFPSSRSMEKLTSCGDTESGMTVWANAVILAGFIASIGTTSFMAMSCTR